MTNNINDTEHDPDNRNPIEIGEIDLGEVEEMITSTKEDRRTAAKCLIFSPSSRGMIAWEMENATPPMKITRQIGDFR